MNTCNNTPSINMLLLLSTRNCSTTLWMATIILYGALSDRRRSSISISVTKKTHNLVYDRTIRPHCDLGALFEESPAGRGH